MRWSLGYSKAFRRGHVFRRRTRRVRATLSAFCYIVTASVATAPRFLSQRGVLATPPAATRRCDTDFRRVGDSEDEMEAHAGGSALSAWGEDQLDRQRARGDTRTSRARPMQKFSLPHFLCYATPTPNHAMQLTPARRTIHVHGSYNPLPAHHARSRQA